jgi:hypothetical protein
MRSEWPEGLLRRAVWCERQYSNESTNNAGTCEALDAGVNAINERMRHRYTNPEGEYYRGRLHKISDRKYDLHCDR